MKANALNFSRRVLHPLRHTSAFLLVVACLISPPRTLAQASPAAAGSDATSLPNAPEPKPQTTENPTLEVTSRVVGYATNKSIVFPDIATREGPLSPSEKFRLFINESISPPYIISPAMAAGFNQAKNVPAGYGQDWSGYGCRFGEELARASSNAFFGSFVLPSVLHQDPRFFPQLHPSLWGSVRYSARRIFITRTDSGIDTFNTSGIAGTIAAEALANSYLPDSERSASKSASRFGTDLAWRFAANMFKNYWPTMFRDMGLNRLKVIPDPNAQQPYASSSN